GLRKASLNLKSLLVTSSHQPAQPPRAAQASAAGTSGQLPQRAALPGFACVPTGVLPIPRLHVVLSAADRSPATASPRVCRLAGASPCLGESGSGGLYLPTGGSARAKSTRRAGSRPGATGRQPRFWLTRPSAALHNNSRSRRVGNPVSCSGAGTP